MESRAEILEKALIAHIYETMTPDGNNRFLSERAICEQFGESRTIVRSAISNLCKQGYLMKIHGKGTFLKTDAQSIFSITRCLQNYEEQGFAPACKVLEKTVVTATPQVAKFLDIRPDTPVLYVRIAYQANRTVCNVTESYLPLSRFPHLEVVDFAAMPILAMLESRYATRALQTENFVDAIFPPLHIAPDLQVDAKTPIMLFESITSGSMYENVVPLEYFKCYYKTDQVRFHFKQQHGIL